MNWTKIGAAVKIDYEKRRCLRSRISIHSIIPVSAETLNISKRNAISIL